MAYTQEDADKLRSAIASGVTTMRNSDGELITYRSLPEMIKALSMIEKELQSSPPSSSSTISSGFIVPQFLAEG